MSIYSFELHPEKSDFINSLETFIVTFFLRYQPDYGSSEVHELLVFNTNMGLMTFPIVVRIPPNIMNSCLKTIPRPVWELRTHCLCVCSLTMFIVFTFLIAIYDARRLFDQVEIHICGKQKNTANFEIFNRFSVFVSS